MNKQLKIFNGKIITPQRIINGGSLLITNGIINAVSETNIEAENADEIDAKGHYISPGFIDIHVHGGGGHDFMDGTETAFLKIAETPCTVWNYSNTTHYPIWQSRRIATNTDCL